MKLRPTGSAAALALALLALIAAGCGEKDEPPTTGPVVAQTTTTTGAGNGAGTGGSGGSTNGGKPATDEELIKATITGFMVEPDAGVCDELITPAFVKAAYGDRAGCVAARKPKALADSATILATRPGPGGARVVTVRTQGGVYAGQTLKVTVVESGNGWKIDKISGNAKVGP